MDGSLQVLYVDAICFEGTGQTMPLHVATVRTDAAE